MQELIKQHLHLKEYIKQSTQGQKVAKATSSEKVCKL